MELLSAPLATAEFIVVDTETNGLAGDACEMTELGAVLVGGGELHERWGSVVRTNAPLRRGIQRFTGITQAMVDDAPSLEAVVPRLRELLRGRVLVAHNAPFDRRVLRQAFSRVCLEWPDPPVICTAALARALLPLQRERGLGRLADALGIEVGQAHRALPDAEACARVLCALFPRLCANAVTVATRSRCSPPGARSDAGHRNGRRSGTICPRRTGRSSVSSPTIRGSTCSVTTPGACCTSVSRSRFAAGRAPISPRPHRRLSGPLTPPWSITR